jgi:hypothetical protein
MNRHAFGLLVCLVLSLNVSGCALLTPSNVKAALDVAKTACLMARYAWPKQEAFAYCGILTAAEKAQAEATIAGVAAAQRSGAAPLPRDAGADQ